jgi:2-hydroxy-3-keto-5-methylthiopentenyl-1-phosphate phosphatase
MIALQRMEKRNDSNDGFLVFCDFDGTISTVDVVDAFLESFAAPEWTEIEKRWRNREIGSRECLDLQIAEVRALGRDEMDRFLADIRIDPGFADLARAIEPGELTILSDGFDLFIRSALARAGLGGIPFFANHLEWQAGERPRAEFPYQDPRCPMATGSCKCRLAEQQAGGRPYVYIGDGQSDFCIAGRADMVLAKGRLARFCEDEDIPHVEFETLRDLGRLLPPGAEVRRAR